MNLFLSIIAFFSLTSAFAEEVGVKLDKISTEKDTTISITKGVHGAKKRYHIVEGAEDLTGDTDVVRKAAMDSWKKACNEWKTELKELNKNNQLLSLNCGKMTCVKEGVESTCTSKATYKLKTLSEE